jgi:hypothetical protein
VEALCGQRTPLRLAIFVIKPVADFQPGTSHGAALFAVAVHRTANEQQRLLKRSAVMSRRLNTSGIAVIAGVVDEKKQTWRSSRIPLLAREPVTPFSV